MLIGAHAILYSNDAESTRTFLQDVLRLDSVDAGAGWLIFALPPTELAVHPVEGPSRQEIFLMCDDIEATVAELRARGAEISQPVTRQSWGFSTSLRVPGGVEIGLYQPLHLRRQGGAST